MNRHQSTPSLSQRLQTIGATVNHFRAQGICEEEVLGSLPFHFEDADLAVYNDLRNAYAATYAAYIIHEAAEITPRITEALNAEDRAAALADLANEYAARIDAKVLAHIVNGFDREIARRGSMIINAIAADCSAILAD